jgi:hypothetical protein
VRAQVKIADLNLAQWDRLQERVQTSYEVKPGEPTVCAVFELAPMSERHAEMPVFEFATLMAELAQIENTGLVAEAALTPDALPDELNRIRNAADPARNYQTGQGLGAGWND